MGTDRDSNKRPQALRRLDAMLKTKSDETGTIDILRPYSRFAMLRSQAIFIDDQLRVRLEAGEREIAELPPGPHSVQVRMGWAKSSIVTVNVKIGKNHKLLIRRKKLSGPVAYLYYTLGAVALVGGLVGMGSLTGAIILLMAPRFGKMHLHTTSPGVVADRHFRKRATIQWADAKAGSKAPASAPAAYH